MIQPGTARELDVSSLEKGLDIDHTAGVTPSASTLDSSKHEALRAEDCGAQGSLSSRLKAALSAPGAGAFLGFAFALFALLHAAPFLFAKIPPLVDLPGHMGRFAVQLNIGSSPRLQENWSFHWALVANMGFDVLIELLSPFMGVERGSWLLAALLAPFTIWGLARISVAVHGRLSPFLILAAPFAMAFPFQMGFVNYCLSCALAFHLFASWVDADRHQWGLGKRLLVFVPGSVVAWFCHAYGWGVLAVMAGGYELVRVAQASPNRRAAAALEHLSRLAALSLPALLLLVWSNKSSGADTAHFFDFATKLAALGEVLRDQNFLLDRLSIALYVGGLTFLVIARPVRLTMELAVPAAILLLCELALPNKLLGSVFADTRLWPVIFQIALLAPDPGAIRPVLARLVVVLGALLALTRLGVMSAGYAQYDRDYTRHLRALDHVPAGASIVTLTPLTCRETASDWRLPRLDHLDGLAIVRREAFVNSQWEIPGGQLLGALRARGTDFNSDPSQVITPESDCDGSVWPGLRQSVAAIPRDRFDYLWLIGFDMAQAPKMPGAETLYADEDSALYRLDPSAAKNQP